MYNQRSIVQTALFEQICSIQQLHEAFVAVARNKGAPGIDEQTTENFKSDLSGNIEQLHNELMNWTYRPKPAKKVEIPKQNGGKRKLGIPSVRDRVVQAAIKQLLEPILDPKFSESSYGFRPARDQKQAINAAQEIAKSGKEFVVDIDLKQFFDTIHHDKLIGRLGRQITDKRVLRLIGMILRSGIMNDGVVEATTTGSVQGSPLSPLLSNVVLDELDKELEFRGLEFCRYADDCNIYVKSKAAAERVMKSISAFITRKLKLEVNTEKSRVGPTSSIKFLGVTIIALTVAISTVSMNKAMAKVKELTPRGTSQSIEQTIKSINSWYVGWANYYEVTQYPAQLRVIEAHVRRRLRARIVDQQKKRRNLFEKLVSRGVPRNQAAIAFSNKRRWALSHTRAVEKAYPNKWFVDEMGLKIKSNGKRPHWFDERKWIKLP